VLFVVFFKNFGLKQIIEFGENRYAVVVAVFVGVRSLK